MTTFKNGKIRNDHIIRADGLADFERHANEFDMSGSTKGSDPTANGFFNGKDPFVNGVKDFLNWCKKKIFPWQFALIKQNILLLIY